VDRGEDGGRVGEDADADEDQRLPRMMASTATYIGLRT
jgi:hypothetical protein